MHFGLESAFPDGLVERWQLGFRLIGVLGWRCRREHGPVLPGPHQQGRHAAQGHPAGGGGAQPAYQGEPAPPHRRPRRRRHYRQALPHVRQSWCATFPTATLLVVICVTFVIIATIVMMTVRVEPLGRVHVVARQRSAASLLVPAVGLLLPLQSCADPRLAAEVASRRIHAHMMASLADELMTLLGVACRRDRRGGSAHQHGGRGLRGVQGRSAPVVGGIT